MATLGTTSGVGRGLESGRVIVSTRSTGMDTVNSLERHALHSNCHTQLNLLIANGVRDVYYRLQP